MRWGGAQAIRAKRRVWEVHKTLRNAMAWGGSQNQLERSGRKGGGEGSKEGLYTRMPEPPLFVITATGKLKRCPGWNGNRLKRQKGSKSTLVIKRKNKGGYGP